MDNTERKFHWCLEKGKTGGRKHRGLRKIKPDIQALREEFQYGTEIEVEDEILESMQNNANEFVEATRVILEEIKV